MPVVDLADLRAAVPPGRPLLGVDVGSRTLGLAVSDPSLMLASPLETLRRTRFRKDAAVLRGVVEARGVGGFVLGLPVSMDGTEGPACQSVRQFGTNLLEEMDLPLAFWDERLSTAAVERVLVEQVDMTRRRRAQVVDKMAAAWILQGALDAMAARARRGADA